MCGITLNVNALVGRQEEHDGTVACDEGAPPLRLPWPDARNNSSRNVFETTGKENRLPSGLWSISIGRRPMVLFLGKGMRGVSLVNLIGSACIQRVDGNVLADRLAPSGSGSHKK